MELKILFDKIINQMLEEEVNDEWGKGIYSRYRKDLEIDKRGSFGERFFMKIFANSKYCSRIEYNDGDQGVWDLKINRIRLEIKTSSLTINKKNKNFAKNKFQNEGIREEKGSYEGVLFLGIAPNDLYIKMVKYEDIPFCDLHSREKAKTGVGYKWDIKLEDMLEVINEDDIISEFEKVFIKK